MSFVWANTSLVNGVHLYANSTDLGGGVLVYANTYDLGGTPPPAPSVGGSLPRRGKWKRHRVEAAEAETALGRAFQEAARKAALDGKLFPLPIAPIEVAEPEEEAPAQPVQGAVPAPDTRAADRVAALRAAADVAQKAAGVAMANSTAMAALLTQEEEEALLLLLI